MKCTGIRNLDMPILRYFPDVLPCALWIVVYAPVLRIFSAHVILLHSLHWPRYLADVPTSYLRRSNLNLNLTTTEARKL